MWVKATLGAGVGMAHYFGVAVVTQNAGLREVKEVLDGLGHGVAVLSYLVAGQVALILVIVRLALALF